MKIKKYSKLKNSKYKVILEDGSSFTVHEDLILKYNLLLKKEIDFREKENILEENNKYLVYDMALKYLGYKARSKKEIYLYLESKDIDRSVISKVVENLAIKGYLDDSKYARMFISDHIKLSNDGPFKIINELEKKGVSKNIINEEIEVFTSDMEKMRIDKLIQKYIKTNHNKSVNALKNKINQNLVMLGYNKTLVIDRINRIKFDDSHIKEKEYEKIYNKLSKKYSGKELELKMRQKMYQKGFRV